VDMLVCGHICNAYVFKIFENQIAKERSSLPPECRH
jgi:hypothetical protein